jgi:xanthine dehydrogenase accessory factor
MDWPFTLRRVLAHKPCVLVTLNLILGSMPRESGARMIVTAEDVHGSIGGGNLEYTAIGRARELLAETAEPRQRHQPVGLGPALNQCCGGAVTLLFEVLGQGGPGWLDELIGAIESRIPAVLLSAIDRDPPLRVLLRDGGPAPPDVPAETVEAARGLLAQPPGAGPGESAPLPMVEIEGDTWWLERVLPERIPLMLFGAGHVGREVARLLQRLPFDLTWVDARKSAFTGMDTEGMTLRRTDDLAGEVGRALPACLFVVMTHSHQLDEDICFEVLQRGDFAWLGLIGSDTKRRRFVQRLERRGIAPERLGRLVCPIGLDGIRGKQPATIALSLAAQLMEETPWTDARH